MAIVTEHVGDIFSAPAHSILIQACNAKGSWGAGVALTFKQKYPQAFQKYKAHCIPKLSSSSSLNKHQRALAGTALLIPPSPSPLSVPSSSYSPSPSPSPSHPAPSAASTSASTSASTHWIACLFTSVSYGRGRDSEVQILRNTHRAITDLARQIDALQDEAQQNESQKKGKGAENEGSKLERDGKGGEGTDENEEDDEEDDEETEKTREKNPGVPKRCYAVPINSGKFGVPWRRTKAVLEAGGVDIVVMGTDPETFGS